MVVHASNPNTWEAEAGGFVPVQCQWKTQIKTTKMREKMEETLLTHRWESNKLTYSHREDSCFSGLTADSLAAGGQSSSNKHLMKSLEALGVCQVRVHKRGHLLSLPWMKSCLIGNAGQRWHKSPQSHSCRQITFCYKNSLSNEKEEWGKEEK